MITGMGYIFSSGNKLLLFVSTLLYKISFNYSDHIIFTINQTSIILKNIILLKIMPLL